MTKTAVHPASLSWDRAERLVGLTDHNSKSDCRSFIAQSDLDATILDNGLDKRNADVRTMVEAFEAWVTSGKILQPSSRPSRGDASKPVRAGGDRRRKNNRRTTGPINGEGIPGQALMDIRVIQRKYDLTCEELLYTVEVLARLLDQEIDLDNFLRSVKADRRGRSIALPE